MAAAGTAIIYPAPRSLFVSRYKPFKLAYPAVRAKATQQRSRLDQDSSVPVLAGLLPKTNHENTVCSEIISFLLFGVKDPFFCKMMVTVDQV